jgi:hypothetical protein
MTTSPNPRRIVAAENLPRWVRNEMETHRVPLGHVSMWTVDANGVYEAWRPTAIFKPKAPKLPDHVDPDRVVDWYALPSWVKGSYRTEAEMRRLQSFTWVNQGCDAYRAYTPDGEDAGLWARE